MSNVLLGSCIGDCLGKFSESKSSDYPPLLEWDQKTFLPSEYHKLEANNYTDDGQMGIMVSESLITNNGFNPSDLAERYVDWIVSGRARGYGRTTLLAIQALQSGTHWSESGVNGSFGNGTAMRAAPFGVFFRNDLRELINSVRVDSAITHKSNEAEAGALTIALAVYYILNGVDDLHLLQHIIPSLPPSDVKNKLATINDLVNSEALPVDVLKTLGTRADVRQTVPSAMYCYLKFKNYRDGIIAAIMAGYDTDTTGAIVGALFGAKYGMSGIPKEWTDQIEDRDKLILLDAQLMSGNNKNYFR